MFTLRLLISLKGHLVGKDELGNLYYQEGYLFSKPNRRPHRWIVYRGVADPAYIPAEWHGWIHFTHEAPLTEIPRWPWQRTKFPPPKTKSQKKLKTSLTLLQNRKKVSLPYVAWKP